MKNLLFICALLGLQAPGCKHEDDHHGDGPYLVTIDIQHPQEGEVAPVDQPLPVKVVFTRSGEQTIHHVNIYVVDQSNVVVATLFEQHVHMPGEFIYESDAYTPTQAGAFKIQAVTTDDAEESPNLKEAGFTVQ